MKLLLVALNAKYIHSNLAVHSLAAYARKYSDRIGVIELTINHSEEVVLKEIYKEKADVVAFSCYIWNIGMVKRISSELKKVQPEVIIWYGGPEVSYDAEQCLKELQYLDGIMLGEGEQTFLELTEHYVEGTRELCEIDGLAFRNNDKITVTKPRMPISLDAIPFPYENIELFKNRIIYYESSRGCPFTCSYCLSSIDKKVRFRSTPLVKRELGLFLKYQIPQVKFVDRTFNCNKKHAMEIWRFIKDNDNGVTNFHFELSADLLEEDELEFLSTLRTGQVQFEIGVQTTNPGTADAIQRRMDFQKLKSNVQRIKSGRNIHQHLDLIAGLPLEGYKSFEKSFQDVYQLGPDQLQLGFLKILKGSFMEEEAAKYGIVYRDMAPYEVLYTEALAYDDVLRLKGVCDMVEVYYNSGQFSYAIRYLEHFYPSPMRLYQEISDYYEKKGYDMMSHSRIRRYEILRDFFREITMESIESRSEVDEAALFDEILILDLYLREDMKSRPGFALAIPPQYNLRELYDMHHSHRKNIHIEPFVYDVIHSAETGQPIKKSSILLFDYNNRDPLNKGAKITELSI